jgi:CheY-like chemotaxis protein
VNIENNTNEERQRKTVLVVDDSAMIRRKVVAAFQAAGFETCREAENGKQAIEVARQVKPDVIMLDLSMPVMNGLEAAPVLRKTLPQTPIILFTLFAGTLSKADISKAGISMVLEKNTPLPTLIHEAQELMRGEFATHTNVSRRLFQCIFF